MVVLAQRFIYIETWMRRFQRKTVFKKKRGGGGGGGLAQDFIYMEHERFQKKMA